MLCALLHDGMMILLGSYESLNDWVADDFMMFLYIYIYIYTYLLYLCMIYICICIYVCSISLQFSSYCAMGLYGDLKKRQSSHNHMVLFVSLTHPLVYNQVPKNCDGSGLKKLCFFFYVRWSDLLFSHWKIWLVVSNIC